MRLWQLGGCRYRKFWTADVQRAMGGRAMLHVITFPREAYAGQAVQKRQRQLWRMRVVGTP